MFIAVLTLVSLARRCGVLTVVAEFLAGCGGEVVVVGGRLRGCCGATSGVSVSP